MCGSRFDVSHALSCKKGSFVTLRHNEIRNLISVALTEVCPDVLVLHIANKSSESRLDISVTDFRIPGQRVFFDVRVFDLSAEKYRGLEISKCFRRNEMEKKRHYNERVTAVKNGTFTPLVLSATGGMGRECKTFYT